MAKGVTPLTDYKIKAEISAFKKQIAPERGRLEARIGDAVAGLSLQLRKYPNGTIKSQWLFRKQKSKSTAKTVVMSLGQYPDVSIQKARRLALEALHLINQGKDAHQLLMPVAQQEDKSTGLTFAQAAQCYVGENEKSWLVNNEARPRRTQSLLRRHINPVMGRTLIEAVTPEDVERQQLEHLLYVNQPDVARKCRDLISAVCLWAQANGHRSLDKPNPTSMKGVLGIKLKPYENLVKRPKNYPTVEVKDMPAFFADLCCSPACAARDALIFMILTTLRSQGARYVQWSDIDFNEGVVSVFEEARKKKGRGAFVCYLSSYAEKFLASRPRLNGGYVFSSCLGARPLTADAIRHVIRRMNDKRKRRGLEPWEDKSNVREQAQGRQAVPHGVSRTSFATWAAEDEHDNDKRFLKQTIDLVLDHDPYQAKGDRYNGAYDRSKQSRRQRDLLESWGRYLVTGKYPDEQDGTPAGAWIELVNK